MGGVSPTIKPTWYITPATECFTPLFKPTVSYFPPAKCIDSLIKEGKYLAAGKNIAICIHLSPINSVSNLTTQHKKLSQNYPGSQEVPETCTHCHLLEYSKLDTLKCLYIQLYM